MISFQIAGIIIIFIIISFYLSQKRLTLKSGKLFLLAGLLVSILLIIDVFSIECVIHSDIFEYWFAEFLCKLYLVFLIIVSTLGLVYLVKDIYKYSITVRRYYDIATVAVILVAAVLIFIFEIEIYYDTKVMYTYGPSCFLCYGFCVFFLIATIIYSIIFRKQLNKSKRDSIQIWMALWIIAAGVQFVFKEFLIVSFASSVALIIIYINLENPALTIDKLTGTFNSTLLEDCIADFTSSKQDFKVVYILMKSTKDDENKKKNALIRISNILASFTNNKLITSKNLYFTFRMEDGFVIILNKQSIDQFFAIFDKLLDEQYYKDFDNTYNIHYLLLQNSDILTNYNDFKLLFNTVIDNNLLSIDCDRTYIDIKIIKKIDKIKETEQILKNAIDNDLVEVYYQPIYSKYKNKITSAEALVRITDNNGKLYYPDSFIEIAEKNGLISKLGEKVFIHVCEFLSKYDITQLGMEYVEINLSVVQCGDVNLANRYIEIMDKYKIKPEQINLEITETASTNLKNIMLDNMNKLIRYGVHFSLDDFGMGNSNLNYIIEMPVKIIKFDRILVNSYFNDPKAKLVIERIIEMIKVLNLEIVLEGIEEKETLDEALKLDIDFIQGYYFSKPISLNQFILLVRNFNKI